MSDIDAIEKILVTDLSNGDALALQKLYKMHSSKLYRFIYSATKDHDDTEDILQTVFIKLWDSHDKLRTDTCFPAFLMTITRNTLYNFFKQRYNQRNLIENFAKQEGRVGPSSDESLIESELFELLHTLVEALPPKRKEIFILNRFKGHTYREIAEMLEISENTVDTQMRKALDFVKVGLSKEVLTSIVFVLFCNH